MAERIFWTSGLSVHTKSMLGALLDYANVDRGRFANAWKMPSGEASASAHAMTRDLDGDGPPQTSLFDDH